MSSNLWYNGKNCVDGAEEVVILAARQYKIK